MYNILYTYSILLYTVVRRDLEEFLRDIESQGDSTEAISFESVIKTIECDDKEALELMKDMPVMVALMRNIHKHAFWRGADFGRKVFLRLADDDTEYIDEEE